MRKALLALTLFVGSISTAFAQYVPPIDTIFIERFDPTSGPDSIAANYNTYTTNTASWNDTNFLSQSGTHSYHTQVAPNDSIIFETDTFSTVGYTNVRISFDHIAKILFLQRGYIQVSKDNGSTWVTLDSNHYKGNSPQFPSTGYFNELSYPSAAVTPYWHGPTVGSTTPTTPTNAWWASEVFDASAILGDTNTTLGNNGWPECKVRFICAKPTSSTTVLAGWFVDNVMVEAAPCELEPPTGSYLKASLYRHPVGARYMPTEALNIKAYDNVGVDSVKLYYRDKGTTAWSTANMTPTTTSSCPDSAEFQYSFTNLLVGDTIEWYLEIYDCACPNITRDPAYSASIDFYTFWRDPAPPPICGTTSSTSFPFVANPPFEEDFENSSYWTQGIGSGQTGTVHRGSFPMGNPPAGKNWVVAPPPANTGFAWSIRQGPTATAATGPNGDHTTGTGKYVYTEADQGTNPTNTALITPCIDLAGMNCASVEFFYHMYGAHTGNLRVDIDTGENSAAWVINVAKLQGAQQNSSADAWKPLVVSLDDYIDDIIRIRFIGVKNSNGLKNDISMDDIRVFEPNPIDLSLISVDNPENGYCSYSSNELLNGVIQNSGCLAVDTVPITYEVVYTSSTTGNTTTSTHTELFTNKVLELGDTMAYEFTTGPDMSGYGTYEIKVYADLYGDTIENGNDTIGYWTVEHDEPLSTFPYIVDFDGSGTVAGVGNSSNPGSHNYDEFTEVPAATSGNFAWMVMNGYTPTVNTGPLEDFSNFGNYLYTEGDYGMAPVSAQWRTECVDLSGMTSPVIQFFYYLHGVDIGALRVQIVKDGENSWSNIGGAMTASTTAGYKDEWEFKEIDLSNFAGDIIKIRFVGQKSGFGDAADICIDEIAIFDKANKDLGIVEIKPPGVRVSKHSYDANANPPAISNDTTYARFKVRNYGKTAISSYTINYTVTPTCGANAGVSTSYSYAVTGNNIAAGGVKQITDNTNFIDYPTGTFEIEAYISTTGDSNSWNDTLKVESKGWPFVFIQNGLDADFENCSVGNEYGFWEDGDMRLFEPGTPAALSGNKGYGTNVGGNIIGNVTEYLYFPRFVGFDTIVGARLRITHDVDFSVGDGGRIEMLDNNTWGAVGFWDPQNVVSQNWYNETNVGAINNAPGWSGNLGTIVSEWPLYAMNEKTAPLILRARTSTITGSSDGWNIDRVEIIIPPQNSAAPVKIETLEYLPTPAQDNHLRVQIENTGAKLLDSCIAEFSVDGGVTWSSPEHVVFNNPIIPGGKKWYEFTSPWVNPASGVANVCVRTSRPNNKQDNNTSDDQFCENITVLDRIVMGTDSSYCNNFDNPAQAPWMTLNTFVKDGNTSWEHGTPSQAPIVSASSAPNVWMTQLDTNYFDRDSSSLFTPVFVVDSMETYQIDFKHNFSTEIYHDGGTFDVTLDGGLTWITIGSTLYGATWFNTKYVTSLDVIKPGWTGVSNGWIDASIRVRFQDQKNAIFRFRFGSDQTFTYTGWAVDDFCFYETNDNSNVYFIGKEENTLEFVHVGHLFPNPTQDGTRLPVSFMQPMDLTITVRNTQGQIVWTSQVHGESGIEVFEIPTSGWAAGMYIVETTSEEGTSAQRLVIQN